MIKTTTDLLIIEIPSGSPVEDLQAFRSSLITMLQEATKGKEEVESAALYYVMELLRNMELSDEQIKL